MIRRRWCSNNLQDSKKDRTFDSSDNRFYFNACFSKQVNGKPRMKYHPLSACEINQMLAIT